MAAKNRPTLLSAVRGRNIVACRRLIDTGEANVNEDRDHYGCTALHWASYRGYLEISELLVSSGADVNIRDKYGGSTALHNASMKIVQLLLCQGADMSIRDNYGRTALDWASSNGYLKIADCLHKWPWTMAIIALKEDLAVYHLLDASTLIDLWQYLGNQ
jgi:ankyrin repeat protein